MNERFEELAALNALGMLEGDEKRTLEGVTIRDRELRSLCAELEFAASELALAIAPAAPPKELKNRIRAKIRSRRGGAAVYSTGGGFWSVAGWAAAAAFAVSSVWLWTEREKLNTLLQSAASEAQTATQAAQTQIQAERARFEQQIATLGNELETLKKRDARAQMQIATLQSSVTAYKQGVAVVVWDSEKHQGVLKLEKMPPVEAGKDYQLWVVDPKNPVPVDAGVVRVNAEGFAKVDFKPLNDVSEASKFALSVEKEGGVPKGEGPIVLIGP
ncbi:MAG: anti-sigma factor [Verrucomicrobiaceae bacterium]|nr:anti-sigma factor [Verrucomicrobiaceae bacterium]